MSSTYSNLKLELMGTGEQSGLWGATTNQNLSAIQQAIGGQASVVFATDANKTLAYTNTNADQDFRAMYLNVTSGVSLTATRSLIVPAVNKLYVVKNATTGGQAITVKIGASTGTTVDNGQTAILYANGSDVLLVSYGLSYLEDGASMYDIFLTEYLRTTGGVDVDGTISASLALVPTGYGALLAAIPDGTTANGTYRGIQAVDLQLSRGNVEHVAKGDYSVLVGGQANQTLQSANHAAAIGGYGNSIWNNYSFIGGGQSQSVLSAESAIVGGSANSISNFCTGSFIAAGSNNGVYGPNSAVTNGSRNGAGAGGAGASSAPYCRSGGYYATTNARYGSDAYASGSFSTTAGTAQLTNNVLRVQTTNATPSRLTANGTGTATSFNTLNLVDNSSVYIKGRVVARNTANGDTKVWTFEGAIKRGANAAATALVAAITPTAGAADAGASAWALAIAADTTNGGLAVTATGAAATTIRWVCRIDTTEVMNG